MPACLRAAHVEQRSSTEAGPKPFVKTKLALPRNYDVPSCRN